MAKAITKVAKPVKKSDTAASPVKGKELSYCAVKKVPERIFKPNVDSGRASLIRVLADKWANGTVLHYYFFDKANDGDYIYYSDGTKEWRTWTTSKGQKDIVRKAFDVWKDLGIGLDFKEVASREDAEIRIGFMQGDGSWSYVGRYILNIGANKRTMNLGWSLTDDIDTAVHELGHTLGFPHEHQNPNAGIVWDEEAVYAALAAPPNNWSRETTHYNIIRKIDPDTVQGSTWDWESIMHYAFNPGLIKEPAKFGEEGLYPPPGLSERDKTWVLKLYPPLEPVMPELKPFESAKLSLAEGEQANFIIQPEATRYYFIRTFGTSDTVMVLFEDEDGELRYCCADDDSGEDYNANLKVRLFKNRKYVLRIRLYWQNVSGFLGVMVW